MVRRRSFGVGTIALVSCGATDFGFVEGFKPQMRLHAIAALLLLTTTSCSTTALPEALRLETPAATLKGGGTLARQTRSGFHDARPADVTSVGGPLCNPSCVKVDQTTTPPKVVSGTQEIFLTGLN